MSFPAFATNNQQAILNGTTYIYNATLRTWTRTSSPLANLTVSGNITTGNANVASNFTSSNVTVSGNLVANGYSNIFIATGTLTNRSALTIAGNVYGRGGNGYHDALTLTNTHTAATNPNKWIRLNQTGGLEIVNSGYTSTIMSLSDGGNLNITGTYQVNGSQAVNGPAFSTVMLTGQTIGASSWSNVIYNGEYYDTHNCYNTTTGVFTPNVAGYYQFNYTAGANSYPSSSGICTVALYKNNFELSRGFRGICNTGGAVVTGTTSCYLNGTTDYVQIKFLQGSSGSVVLESDAGAVAAGGSYANYFNGMMVRGA